MVLTNRNRSATTIHRVNVLLLRPHPGNDRFGLGPFFRVEPLGLEYLGAAYRRAGANVTLGDLRFKPTLAQLVARSKPEIVGISCLHALEYDRVRDLARGVRALAPRARIVVGGHAAAAYPNALAGADIDEVCPGDGEAFAHGGVGRVDLDEVPLPARDLVAPYASRYYCLHHRPVALVETARGCPFRCNFCAVWSFNERTFRVRAIEHVVADLQATSDRVFVIDDLFFHPADRSMQLARALERRGVKKKWMLVQSRTDVVARHPELLAAWSKLAERLDVFFGFEAPTNSGLDELSKDADVSATQAAIDIARELGVGVTGNFVVDPDWSEDDFHQLWAFVDENALQRAGYTLLTPLPGTQRFTRFAKRVEGQPWFKYDMHHLLWEPKLGSQRFFELYAETWRRSVLNLKGERGMGEWLRRVEARHAFEMVRMLLRTQKMMSARAYLDEHSSAR